MQHYAGDLIDVVLEQWMSQDTPVGYSEIPGAVEPSQITLPSLVIRHGDLGIILDSNKTINDNGSRVTFYKVLLSCGTVAWIQPRNISPAGGLRKHFSVDMVEG